MSVNTAKDTYGNDVLLMPNMNIRYVKDETHIGLSDLDCAAFLTDLSIEKVKIKLAKADKNLMQRDVYMQNHVRHRFYGYHSRERPLVRRDGIFPLCYHVGGSDEKARALTEALDCVHPVASQSLPVQAQAADNQRVITTSLGVEFVQTEYSPKRIRELIGARASVQSDNNNSSAAVVLATPLQSDNNSSSAAVVLAIPLQSDNNNSSAAVVLATPLQSDNNSSSTAVVPAAPTTRKHNTKLNKNVISFWSKYAFEQDDIGNWIIPGSVFGCDVDVRLQFTTRGLIVMDVIAAIMAIERKCRKSSGEVWRDRLTEYHSIIQEDLLENEGNLLISDTNKYRDFVLILKLNFPASS